MRRWENLQLCNISANASYLLLYSWSTVIIFPLKEKRRDREITKTLPQEILCILSCFFLSSTCLPAEGECYFYYFLWMTIRAEQQHNVKILFTRAFLAKLPFSNRFFCLSKSSFTNKVFAIKICMDYIWAQRSSCYTRRQKVTENYVTATLNK